MNNLELKTNTDPNLAVTKIEIGAQGGQVFRPQYSATLLNERNVVVDRMNHIITDSEWGNWGMDTYDHPYLAAIILARYEQKSGVTLTLSENDTLQTATETYEEDGEEFTDVMIDYFNDYLVLVKGFIAEEEVEKAAEAAAAAALAPMPSSAEALSAVEEEVEAPAEEKVTEETPE